MMRRNPYSVSSLIALPAIILAAMLAGCAATESKSGTLDDSKSGTLAIIQIEKRLQTSPRDCPVSV